MLPLEHPAIPLTCIKRLLVLKANLGVFLSGRFTQVLLCLYFMRTNNKGAYQIVHQTVQSAPMIALHNATFQYSSRSELGRLDCTLPGLTVIKHFSCSVLSMKFIMLIYVIMSTIVGILTFISKINTSESLQDNLSSV